MQEKIRQSLNGIYYTKNLLTIKNASYNYLIKVISKEEYAASISNGELYMNSTLYYSGLDDNFRGDKFDSAMPIDPSGLRIEKFNNEAKGDYFIDAEILNMTIRNENSNQPIFCCSMLNGESTFIKENKIYLRNDFYMEMKKFGNYFIIIDMKELLKKLYHFTTSNQLVAYCDDVKYVDINKEYNSQKVLNKEYDGFMKEVFTKDNSYKNQHEFRIIIFRQDFTSIFDNENYYIAKLTPFKNVQIGELDDLLISGIVFN